MGRFEGKVGIVTGASRGIGLAIASQLAEGGCSVVNFARNPEAGARVETSMADCVFRQVDVSKAEEVQGAIRWVQEKYGAIDLLVNNAGITRDQLIIRMDDDDWKQVIDVNLSGAYHCMKACIRHMVRARQGAIVNVSSVVAESGNPGQSNYAASKAGIIGLSRSVAKEVASRGIRVNVVSPGFIETDMTDTLDKSIRESYLDNIPLGRAGKCEEVARLVSFLLSDQASYITGQVIGINGGLYP